MRTAPVILIVLLATAAGASFTYWRQLESSRVPNGLARANGRIEVERVSVSSKFAGRLAEVRVNEGDVVESGEVVARLDTTETGAQLAAAKAALHRAHQGVARAQAEVALREAELRLAESEMRRTSELMRTNVATAAELDRRSAQRDVAKAFVDGARVGVEDARAAVTAAEARVAEVEAALADMRLKTPVAGRVEYRLAQVGEVVPAGGRVVTVLDTSDVHMTIFLPTRQAGRVELGSEARIALDSAPEFVIPSKVTFVAGEAQFTPRYVETATEREKMMYRIKLHIDPALLQRYRGYVKAGMTGNAYVKMRSGAEWPPFLTPRTPDGAR